jgi:hypothetical protein
MTQERKLVLEFEEYIDIEDVFHNNTVSVVCEHLRMMEQEMREKSKGTDQTVTFNAVYSGYSGNIELKMELNRPETDSEYKARMDQDAKRLAKRAARLKAKKDCKNQKLIDSEAEERELFERLKQKFGE